METRGRRLHYLVAGALLVLSLFPLWVAARNPTNLNDDAYITLTYAQNLAAGRGFVYNWPPATLGTTTPLLTLLVAGLGALVPWVPLDTLAVFLTALCWAGIGWLFFAFRERWRISVVHVLILQLVLIGSGWIAYLGMEAYLFAFLLVLAFSLFFADRIFLAGLAVGFLFLTRGEGVLVLGVMGAIRFGESLLNRWPAQDGELGSTGVRNARSVLRAAVSSWSRLGAGFAFPAGLWSLYALLTFGHILPNTLAAKQAQGQIGMTWPFWHRLTREWMPVWGQRFAVPNLPVLNAWWWLIGVGFVVAVAHPRYRRWLAFVAWIVLYAVGYAVLGVSAYGWYQLPVHFGAQLLFALGLTVIVDRLWHLKAAELLRWGLCATLLIAVAFFLARPTVVAALRYEGDPRAPSYRRMARWFREHAEPDATVAYIEIGYLGYFTQNRIVDVAGLVLPEAVSHVADGDFAWAFWYYEPDYYVDLSDFDWALGSIRENPEFESAYDAVVTLPGPREADLVIYQRVEPSSS
ncbi:MAG: hypothetical protein ACP5JG_18105 [Anaerolineae bacterium]